MAAIEMSALEPDTASLLAASRRTTVGRGRKSPLYRWFDRRYEALARGFEKNPPSWVAMADFFNRHKMLTVDGLPQTAASVRSTWKRVEAGRNRRIAIPADPDLPMGATHADDFIPADLPEMPAEFAPARPRK